MCAATIIVVDTSETALTLAGEGGADHLVKADGGEVDAVKMLTGGIGAEAVIDFVGEKGTTSKGLEMTRPMGSYYIGVSVIHDCFGSKSLFRRISGNVDRSVP